jgi:hypothetical protein
MTITVKLDTDDFSGLSEDEIKEAQTILGIVCPRHAIFQYFLRFALDSLLDQCKDPDHDKLIAWPPMFVMQKREPGFLAHHYRSSADALAMRVGEAACCATAFWLLPRRNPPEARPAVATAAPLARPRNRRLLSEFTASTDSSVDKFLFDSVMTVIFWRV